MTWFKVDDILAFHPKAVAAGNAAMGLWVRAGSWSSFTLTDGHVPEHMLPSFGEDAAGLAKRLVVAGLWERVDGGYVFHDFDDYNPRAETVHAERAKAAERKARWRAKRRAESSPDSDPDPREPDPDWDTYVPEDVTVGQERDNGSGHAGVYAGQEQDKGTANEPIVGQVQVSGTGHAPVPIPRPDPTRPESTSGYVSSSPYVSNARARDGVGKQPMPEHWAPDHEHTLIAAHYELDVGVEATLFRDHAADQCRTSGDWDAAFRNWLTTSWRRRRGADGRYVVALSGSQKAQGWLDCGLDPPDPGERPPLRAITGGAAP